MTHSASTSMIRTHARSVLVDFAPKHAAVREVREERVETRPGFFDRVFHRRRAA